MSLTEFCKFYNITMEELQIWQQQKPNLYALLMSEKQRLNSKPQSKSENNTLNESIRNINIGLSEIDKTLSALMNKLKSVDKGQ